MDKNYKLYQGDCLEIMKDIPDKSINLVLIDPPYNIGKDTWDEWDTVEDYIEFMGKVFLETQRVLKDNGSFYFFHNDFLQMSELQCWIRRNTNFKFKSLITWDKLTNADTVQIGSLAKGYGALRNYFSGSTCEYCVYYTFDTKDKTGLAELKNKKNLFTPIKKYLREEKRKSGLTLLQINQLFGINISDGIAKRYFGDSQWELPTEDKYIIMQSTGFWQKPYEELKEEYDSLLQEYEGIRQECELKRYAFTKPSINMKGSNLKDLKSNLRGLTTVWDFDRPKQNYKLGHITPKPINLLQHIINISSNENDCILDCFMGSGSTGVACVNTNRKFIGIELEEKYYDIAKDRLQNVLKATVLDE